MANMRNTRDTFLHLVFDAGITVHPVRFDKDSPDSGTLQVGAVNITFHDADYTVKAPATHYVTLDILSDAELSALDQEEQLVALLQNAGYTPLLDYSGSTPVPVGLSKLYWDTTSIKFRTVAAADYFHRSAIMQLRLRYV